MINDHAFQVSLENIGLGGNSPLTINHLFLKYL